MRRTRIIFSYTVSLTQIKELSAVPEPGNLGLFATGVVLILINRQMRQKAGC